MVNIFIPIVQKYLQWFSQGKIWLSFDFPLCSIPGKRLCQASIGPRLWDARHDYAHVNSTHSLMTSLFLSSLPTCLRENNNSKKGGKLLDLYVIIKFQRKSSRTCIGMNFYFICLKIEGNKPIFSMKSYIEEEIISLKYYCG